MRPLQGRMFIISRPRRGHMSIVNLAPGGTKSPNIPIMPLAAQFPQDYLFRVCTGKYPIPDNSFRWASFKEGHPYK